MPDRGDGQKNRRPFGGAAPTRTSATLVSACARQPGSSVRLKPRHCPKASAGPPTDSRSSPGRHWRTAGALAIRHQCTCPGQSGIQSQGPPGSRSVPIGISISHQRDNTTGVVLKVPGPPYRHTVHWSRVQEVWSCARRSEIQKLRAPRVLFFVSRACNWGGVGTRLFSNVQLQLGSEALAGRRGSHTRSYYTPASSASTNDGDDDGSSGGGGGGGREDVMVVELNTNDSALVRASSFHQRHQSFGRG